MKTTNITYDDLLIQIILDDKNFLIIGPAGYGKSYLINRIQEGEIPDFGIPKEDFEAFRLSNVLYAAPSGIAARNINGVTLHSLFKMLPVTPQPQYIDVPITGERAALLKNARHLVIDEISMVSCDILDKIDLILKTVRNDNEPFGGIRLIMIGDPFQLQPVPQKDKRTKKIMKMLYPGIETYTFYNSRIFQDETFQSSLKIYNLEYDFRHENDKKYGAILSSIRIGIFSDMAANYINSRVDPNDDDVVDIRLVPTNRLAKFYNDLELKKLPDEEDVSEIEIKMFNTEIHLMPDMYPLEQIITLKTGMKIIFVMNDKNKRWVNGTRGVITKKTYNAGRLETVFVSAGDEEYEVGREWYDIYYPFYNKKEHKIIPKKIASVYQFPFLAGWAITIHRSQSLTLNKGRLQLGHRLFAEGQLYVALSRVKNIEDITINRLIDKSDITVLPETIRFYNEYLLPKSRSVIKERYTEAEHIENLKILMADSVVNNFSGTVDFSPAESEELKDYFYEEDIDNDNDKAYPKKIENRISKDNIETVNDTISQTYKKKNPLKELTRLK
jgi:hypothetical protein